MRSSSDNETTNLLPSSQRISLPDTLNNTKSHIPICKAIGTLISLCLIMLAISSIFKHPSTSDTQLLNISPSIRGGDDASGLDYPWMASWRFDDIHCCTGALIHQNPPIIVTAAHCVTCEQTTVDLRRTLTDPPDPNAESHDILYWIQHPNYEHPTISSNDIALVVLSGTTNIEPIELVPPKISTSNVYPEGTPMDILGYGFIDEADTIISQQLQHGVITYWDKTQCQIYLDEFCEYGDRWDNNAMLCGFDQDISTERGDSGGPGLMNGLLAGINSWSPPTENCQSISGPDYQILDVFVDVGSVRHWIEDTKPTQDTYFIGIHICDDAAATSDGLFVVLHGSNGRSSQLLAMTNPEITSEAFFSGSFMVFRFDNVDNIGWIVEAITFQSESNDALCIDMVVAARLDGMELIMGNTQQFWMENPCNNDFTPCYTQYTLRLYRGCGSSNNINNFDDLPISSLSTDRNDYSMIIHVCDTEITAVGGSLDNIFARMHGVTGSTDWFQLKNSAMNTSLSSDGIFIFNVDATTDIGVNIDSIEFQSDNNDGLCIDKISAGSAKYPYYWKGSHEEFFIDNPCDVNPINEIECSTLKSVSLNCYDF